MKIAYDIIGVHRKPLVDALSQELKVTATYCRAPSFAYELGSYHLDRFGTLGGPDNRELIADLCGLHGFKAVSEEYDTPLPEGENTPDLSNLQMTEREELGLGRERREDFQGENGMRASDVPEHDEDFRLAESGAPESPDCLTIEFPLNGFTPEKFDNLIKLVGAKAPLLKVALDTDALPIQVGEETIKFPWFRGDSDGDQIKAYATLVGLLCKTALRKQRVTAKEKDVQGSQKYAMRCWLLSLGFIGDEYKAARKILLSKLDGNSSWKSGKKAEVCGEKGDAQ